MTRRPDVQLEFARNIVALSRAVAREGEGQELSELHALAVVGALHHLIYRSYTSMDPIALLQICDDVVQLAVAFSDGAPARAAVDCRARPHPEIAFTS